MYLTYSIWLIKIWFIIYVPTFINDLLTFEHLVTKWILMLDVVVAIQIYVYTFPLI